MAKKEATILDVINKKQKANVCISVDQLLETEKHVIPVSPSLDFALNGGIPEGSWVLMSGIPKCGKTTVSLKFASNAQKPENGSREVYFFNIEGRLKKMNLEGVGLDLDKFHIITSTEEKILTGEDYLTIATDILKSESKAVLIFDSLSGICPADRVDDSVSAAKRPSTPKMVSDFTKQMAGVVPIRNHIVICIQHLISNTGGFGPSKMEDGGIKIQYQADVRIRQKSLQTWKIKDDTVGHAIGWEVLCSALGPPNMEATSYHRFGQGIDANQEIFSLAVELGLIFRSGAWYSFDYKGMEDKKFQGEEKVLEEMRSNPELVEYLESSLKSFRI